MKKQKIIAKDGHLCDSKEEAVIDDFLYQSGIEHKKVPMRWGASQYFYTDSSSYPDWWIYGEYVEYLGLSGAWDYDKKVEKKINSAKRGRHYHFLRRTRPYKIKSINLIEVPVTVFPIIRTPLSSPFVRNFGNMYSLLGIELHSIVSDDVILSLYPWEFIPLSKMKGNPFFTNRTGKRWRRQLSTLLSYLQRSGFRFDILKNRFARSLGK